MGVLRRQMPAGATIEIDGATVRLPQRLALGHKIALRSIAAGEKILKYGVPIGSATQAIGKGEHVHLHNMQSDYINPIMRKEITGHAP